MTKYKYVFELQEPLSLRNIERLQEQIKRIKDYDTLILPPHIKLKKIKIKMEEKTTEFKFYDPEQRVIEEIEEKKQEFMDVVEDGPDNSCGDESPLWSGSTITMTGSIGLVI